DLADQIDDYICVFEGAGDLTMDTFVMLLFALIVVVIALVFLSKLLYDKYVKKVTGTTTAAGLSASVVGIGGGALLPGGAASREGSRLSEPKEVLASKKARNGALGGGARVGGGFGGAGIGGGGPKGGIGGGGGGTAILRKRISRKSPGPELTQKKRTVLPPSNINGSDMQSVQWAIHLFRWLYSDLVVVNKLLQDWVGTVNTALLSYVEQHEMIVEVVRVLPESLPPNMSSILCEPAEQPNEVELLFDLETTPVLQIKAFRSTNQKTEVSHYKATVSRLKTRMSVIVNYFALKGEMKVEGFPDIKIHLNSIGPLKTANAQDEKKQSDLIVDLLTSSIRDVVYPIDFSIYSTCPRLMGEEPEEMAPLDYSGYGVGCERCSEAKRILLETLQDFARICTQPYCVVEMDEPAQKHQSAGKAGPSPLWDETFLFDLSNHSTELLFEVYDSVAVGNDDKKFLGLGLVGIDELANGPASTQILELQPRPYETETITGTLMVEFVFIDAPPAPAPRRQYMQQSFARDGIDRMTTSTPAQAAATLPGAGGKHTVSSAPTSPAKAGTNLTTSTSFSERNKRFEMANTNRLNKSFLKPPAATDYGLNGTKHHSESTPVSPALSSASQSLSAATLSGSSPYDVNRTQDKKPRNIFGTLRNKLSLSKKSKSLENSQYSPTHVGQIHSASSTLSRGSSMDQRSIFKSLSRKSSISESSAVSGISNASGRTFVHEESTLLLETLENNILRHYLVPIEVALRQKAWKRKGVKLHIYNDHTFIAKHIKGGVLCHVCNRSILRRPGKQGYECRDCLIQCHKPCHVRTPQACPNPKILSVQLATLPVLIE
ncbi:AAEL014872-PA, partial [Aedes aegypti]